MILACVLVTATVLGFAAHAKLSDNVRATKTPYYGQYLGILRNPLYGLEGVVWIASDTSIQITDFSLQPPIFSPNNITFWIGPAHRNASYTEQTYPSKNGLYLKPSIMPSLLFYNQLRSPKIQIARRPNPLEVSKIQLGRGLASNTAEPVGQAEPGSDHQKDTASNRLETQFPTIPPASKIVTVVEVPAIKQGSAESPIARLHTVSGTQTTNPFKITKETGAHGQLAGFRPITAKPPAEFRREGSDITDDDLLKIHLDNNRGVTIEVPDTAVPSFEWATESSLNRFEVTPSSALDVTPLDTKNKKRDEYGEIPDFSWTKKMNAAGKAQVTNSIQDNEASGEVPDFRWIENDKHTNNKPANQAGTEKRWFEIESKPRDVSVPADTNILIDHTFLDRDVPDKTVLPTKTRRIYETQQPWWQIDENASQESNTVSTSVASSFESYQNNLIRTKRAKRYLTARAIQEVISIPRLPPANGQISDDDLFLCPYVRRSKRNLLSTLTKCYEQTPLPEQLLSQPITPEPFAHSSAFQLPMEPLQTSSRQRLMLDLPRGRKLEDFSWIAVYDHSQNIPLSSLIIPKASGAAGLPKPTSLKGLSPALSKQVRSTSVQLLDMKTIIVKNFFFEGDAPGAWFMAGKTAVPGFGGHILPILNDDGSYDCDFLKQYDGSKDVILKLPGNLTVKDIFNLSVFCVPYSISFAHVYIPYKELMIPPSTSLIEVPFCQLEPQP